MPPKMPGMSRDFRSVRTPCRTISAATCNAGYTASGYHWSEHLPRKRRPVLLCCPPFALDTGVSYPFIRLYRK